MIIPSQNIVVARLLMFNVLQQDGIVDNKTWDIFCLKYKCDKLEKKYEKRGISLILKSMVYNSHVLKY